MSILKVNSLCKSFGKTKVLKGITFTQEEGTVLSIIGSSGSGNTTLLRCITGLETADCGKIIINGHATFDSESQVKPTNDRSCFSVLQSVPTVYCFRKCYACKETFVAKGNEEKQAFKKR